MDLRGGAFDPAEVKAYIASLVPEPTGWDDLRFPAQGINPPGAASDPTVDATTGLLEFAGNKDTIIAGVAQMPHGWKSGSTVYPHLHLRFPTSAALNTQWKFEYDVANVTGSFSQASGTYRTLRTIAIPNPQSVNQHVLGTFGDMPMTGYMSSAIILWKITRLASSDPLDTDTNTCLLLEFDIHYEMDKFGTATQAPE